MNSPILGIDISKDSLDVQLIIADTSQHAVFENTPKGHKRLVPWLQKRCGQEQVHVCLEATGQYAFPVAEVLYAADHLVSLVNPSRISAYARSLLARNKTDLAPGDRIGLGVAASLRFGQDVGVLASVGGHGAEDVVGGAVEDALHLTDLGSGQGLPDQIEQWRARHDRALEDLPRRRTRGR